MEDSHELSVGNKQQVTQMYTSHATQLVIHLTILVEVLFPVALSYTWHIFVLFFCITEQRGH